MARDAGAVSAFRLASEACPLPPAVEILGERWTWLILRATMLGLRHFEDYQAALGIARNILSDRLSRLVTANILARTPDPNDRRKVVYAFTERGSGLVPVIVALRQWAMDGGLHKPSHPTLSDRRDKRPVARLTVTSHDGRPLGFDDLVWIDENGTELTLPLSASSEATEAA
jgi:DNA-binding HxlR family transcriptional regulator